MSAAEVTVNRCVLCGAPEPFGLSICPGCGGAAHAVGDTLIFVRGGEGPGDRAAVERALGDLVQGRAHRSEYDLVARGHRALIRVPSAAAETAIRQLALRGIPAESRAARRSWIPVPAVFYLLLVAIIVVGGLAGQAALPVMRWSSPLMSALLLLGAQAALRRPLIASSNRHPVFSTAAETVIAETFARLPDCDARALLADVVGAGERVIRSLSTQPGPSTPEDIEQLVTLACGAALNLADLEVALAALVGDPSADKARALRDHMVERFHAAVAVLHKLRAAAIEADPGQEALAQLLEELGGNADAFRDAQREVSRVLTSPEQPGVGARSPS